MDDGRTDRFARDSGQQRGIPLAVWLKADMQDRRAVPLDDLVQLTLPNLNGDGRLASAADIPWRQPLRA